MRATLQKGDHRAHVCQIDAARAAQARGRRTHRDDGDDEQGGREVREDHVEGRHPIEACGVVGRGGGGDREDTRRPVARAQEHSGGGASRAHRATPWLGVPLPWASREMRPSRTWIVCGRRAATAASCVTRTREAPVEAQALVRRGHDLTASRLVEGPRGLIRENHRGVGSKRAADRDALGLSARKLARAVGARAVKAEARQDLTCASDGLRFGRARQHEGHRDVLFHGQLGQKLAVLEHKAEATQAQVGEHALRHGRHLFTV